MMERPKKRLRLDTDIVVEDEQFANGGSIILNAQESSTPPINKHSAKLSWQRYWDQHRNTQPYYLHSGPQTELLSHQYKHLKRWSLDPTN
jgi:hypothetical protein